MILITIEEIAVYVKKEIIRDLFADIKKYQCVIDIWLNGKLLPKNIARVSQYFLNETKDQLMDAYNKRFALSFRKREWVITSEADTLDEPPYANLFIDDSSNDYDYSINQIDTKEITVQDKNRELQKALVNTEVTFKKQADYDDDEYTALNERPAYLLKMKSGEVYLALQNYDGEDYYILYQPD